MSISRLENAAYDLGIDAAKLASLSPVGVAANVPTATTTTAGTVLKATAVADAAGANPTKAEFDALLAALRTAGVVSV